MGGDRMSDQLFEYVVVQLEHGGWKDGDRQLTEQVNRVAAHGWRLVTVVEDSHRMYAYLERPASQS